MILIPANFEGLRTLKDKTLKLTFESNELSPEQWAEIAKNNQAFGYLAFKKDPFSREDKEMMDGLKSDYENKGKSKSQELRAILFLNWKQKPDGFETSEDYYNHHMDKIKAHYKNKLD